MAALRSLARVLPLLLAVRGDTECPPTTGARRADGQHLPLPPPPALPLGSGLWLHTANYTWEAAQASCARVAAFAPPEQRRCSAAAFYCLRALQGTRMARLSGPPLFDVGSISLDPNDAGPAARAHRARPPTH